MKISIQALTAIVVCNALSSDASSCVQDKVNEWVASNTTLYQDFVATMETDAFKAAAAACTSEIDAYTAAAEASCQLEMEYDSPQNYGDRWLQVIPLQIAMNAPSTNGALYLDGKYDLASMFAPTGVFTVLDPIGYPTPEQYATLCFAEVYTGQLDDETFNLWSNWTFPPEFGGMQIFDLAYPPITPEMYCNVKWGAIDQAYWDLKTCALAEIGAPVNMTKEEMIAIYDAAKAFHLDCSNAICSPIAESDAAEEAKAVETSTASPSTSFVGLISVLALVALNII